MKLISAIEYKDNRCLIRVTSQLKIEEAIMNENSKRFKLAYSSPLFKRNILNQIDYCAEKKAADKLLFNNTLIPGLDFETQNFLSLLHNEHMLLIPHYINPKQWIAHWNRSRESTSSSMLRLHFGHYIMQKLSSILTQSRCDIINLAINNRISL